MAIMDSSIVLEHETQACIHCEHFFRNYIQYFQKYMVPTAYGHCVYPRMKLRKVDDVCEHFQEKTPMKFGAVASTGQVEKRIGTASV